MQQVNKFGSWVSSSSIDLKRGDWVEGSGAIRATHQVKKLFSERNQKIRNGHITSSERHTLSKQPYEIVRLPSQDVSFWHEGFENSGVLSLFFPGGMLACCQSPHAKRTTSISGSNR
jgi:hypothetical protein